MRPVHLYDLDAATRAVLAAHIDDRELTANAVVDAARTADRYRKRLGKAHPQFGTGTLASAAAGLPRRSSPYCHATYRVCLGHILDALSHQSA